jgi:hypothetical protein
VVVKILFIEVLEMGWRLTRELKNKRQVRGSLKARRFESLETRLPFSVDMVGFVEPAADGGVPATMEDSMPMLLDGDAASDVIRELDFVEFNPPTVVSESYDDQGRLVSQTLDYDHDGDGAADWRQLSTFEYDTEGRLIGSSYSDDEGADGSFESTYSSTTAYDDNGNVVLSSSTGDSDGDGNADYSYSTEYAYDEEGRNTLFVSTSDDNGDAITDSSYRATYSYDATGNLIAWTDESDTNGDGVVDYRSTMTAQYDDMGRQTAWTQTSDEDGDGIIDSTSGGEMTYDASGNLLTTTYHGGKGGENSTSVSTYTYLADGRTESARFELDNTSDGVIDYVSTETFAYDELGNLIAITTTIDENGDGVIDSTIVADTFPSDVIEIGGPDGELIKTDNMDDSGGDGTIYYMLGQIGDAMRSGENTADLDVNGDGTVDNSDRVDFITTNLNSYVGDVNFDGLFDSSDLVAAFQSGTFEDGIDGNSDWSSGDWDGDGDFTSSDLVFAFQSGGYDMGARPSLARATEVAVDAVFGSDDLDLGTKLVGKKQRAFVA